MPTNELKGIMAFPPSNWTDPEKRVITGPLYVEKLSSGTVMQVRYPEPTPVKASAPETADPRSAEETLNGTVIERR